jgi:hypothetical protein
MLITGGLVSGGLGIREDERVNAGSILPPSVEFFNALSFLFTDHRGYCATHKPV